VPAADQVDSNDSLAAKAVEVLLDTGKYGSGTKSLAVVN